MANHPVSRVAYPARSIVCGFLSNVFQPASARTADPSHGPLIVGSDPGRAQRKAGPGTFYRGGIPECAAAVRRAADVQPHGPAAARRLTVGLVGRDGVLPVDAAGRLCLCAFSHGHAKSPAGCRRASCAPDRRAHHAAAVDCRLGRASGIRVRPSGCWACSQFRSGCRSSRSPRTTRFCRRGSCAPATAKPTTLIFSMPPPTSAVFSRFSPTLCCLSLLSLCTRKAGCGAAASRCSSR